MRGLAKSDYLFGSFICPVTDIGRGRNTCETMRRFQGCGAPRQQQCCHVVNCYVYRSISITKNVSRDCFVVVLK